jgi:alkanesulfonate monooxygenase SsuD/methylene tetrahydromethanopterin reductase-like flavin-dependent oxidoreductase (luciferase family)
MVGLGIGWRKKEFEAFGVPMYERVGRTSELIRICRAAWDHERFSFDGEHFHFREVAVTPKPYGYLPILLGGSVPAAAARAGKLADGFIATPKNDIGAFRRQVAIFDEAARARGRDPLGMPIGFHVDGWLSADGRLADYVSRAMAHMVGTYALWREQDAGSASQALPPVDEAQLRARSLMGTPADVLSQAQPWIDEFGARDLHMVVRLHYPGMRADDSAAAVRSFAADVMPKLRSLAKSG